MISDSTSLGCGALATLLAVRSKAGRHGCRNNLNYLAVSIDTDDKAQPSPRVRRGPQTPERTRVPYPPGIDFEERTKVALWHARHRHYGYGRLLSLVQDCHPLDHMRHKQQLGASYKRLEAIAQAVGMDEAERVGWYEVAEGIPLSERHAEHILSKLRGGHHERG